MKLSAILAPMLAAKADHALIEQVILAYEAQQSDALERRREHERQRQARKRDKSRDITGLPRDRRLVSEGVPVEDKTSNLEIEPQVKKQTAPSRDVDGFISELSSDVPSDLLAEFVKVRRKKRGALTAYAARLFRDDAAKVSMSVADAAKECVRSSWITVKPEYFGNRQRAGPAGKPNPGLDATKALMEKLNAAAPSETEANPAHLRLVAFSGG
jgi:hypothetical protein